MDHEQLALGKLERDDLEWNAALVRPKEEDAVWFARCRRSGIDGVCAVLDDVQGALEGNAVAAGRWSEADRQVISPFCPT